MLNERSSQGVTDSHRGPGGPPPEALAQATRGTADKGSAHRLRESDTCNAPESPDLGLDAAAGTPAPGIADLHSSELLPHLIRLCRVPRR